MTEQAANRPRIAGIVCEYNPFHGGHQYQINCLRRAGFDLILCAMSGNYTQRGEIAIADKYTRAEAAVRCGADLVLELPFPFSSLSAEGFARAGVHILAGAGANTLSFGSESADESLLRRAADLIGSPDFVKAYAASERQTGSAKAYFDTLSRLLGDETALLSNDILGISYLAAIKELKADMQIFPIKREGAAYKETILGEGFPSASALREAVKNSPDGFLSLTESEIPQAALLAFKEAQRVGKAPVLSENIEKEILSFFKLMTPAEILQRAAMRSGGGQAVCADGCGLTERLCNAAKNAKTLSEMLSAAYNNRYPDARINRVLLFSLFGVSELFEKAVPDYTILLGASERGRAYLSNLRKTSDFPIVTKPADTPQGAATEILRLSDAFYAEALPGSHDSACFLKCKPYLADQKRK